MEGEVKHCQLIYQTVKTDNYDKKLSVSAYGYPFRPANTENVALSGAMTEQEKI